MGESENMPRSDNLPNGIRATLFSGLHETKFL